MKNIIKKLKKDIIKKLKKDRKKCGKAQTCCVQDSFYPEIKFEVKSREERDPFSYDQYFEEMTGYGYTPLTKEEFWRRHPSN